MALKTHIIYRDVDGEIVASFLYEEGWAPTQDQMDGWPAGCSHLEADPTEPVARKETHCVNVSGTPTLEAKDQATQDAEANATRKLAIEKQIAELDTKKAALEARSFDTTGIQTQIDALLAEHATL